MKIFLSNFRALDWVRQLHPTRVQNRPWCNLKHAVVKQLITINLTSKRNKESSGYLKFVSTLQTHEITNHKPSHFLFTFFKIYHFYIQKLLYPLQYCVIYLKKIIFFCHHNFMKKAHSKFSKNEPENIPYIKITYLYKN